MINEINTKIFNIKKYLKKYSIKDIISSLFCLTNWLPNSPSFFKNLLLYYIFLNNNPNNYCNNNLINSYDDFYSFSENLIKILPNFVTLEDFIPELDWGEIRFFFNKNLYKILYGSNTTDIYDFIQAFQIQHITFDDEYLSHRKSSPKEELELILNIQHIIIENIVTQPKIDNDNNSVKSGNFEIPSEKFWQNIKEFINNNKFSQLINNRFLEKYSIEIGKIKEKNLIIDQFVNFLYEDKLPKKFFIKFDNEYYLFLPREMVSLFISYWEIELKKLKNKISNINYPWTLMIGNKIYDYILERFNSRYFFLNISIFNENKINELIFNLAIISKNKIILIYILNPFKNYEEEITDIYKKNQQLLNNSTINQSYKFYLHNEKCIIEIKNPDYDFKIEVFFMIPKLSLRSTKIKNLPIGFKNKFILLDEFLGIIDEIESLNNLSDFIDYLDQNKGINRSPFSTLFDKFASFIDTDGVLNQGALNFDIISLDPHWGTNFRFKKLKEFWNNYPKINYFGHPKSYKIEKNKNQLQLISKIFKFSTYCRELNDCIIFTTLNFEYIENIELIKLLNILCQSIDYNLFIFRNVIELHSFFNEKKTVRCLMFIKSNVINNKKYNHLNHLIPNDNEYWKIDSNSVYDSYFIRIVINDLLLEELSKVKDKAIENKLLIDILKEINNIIIDDEIFKKIVQEINKTKDLKPSFKIEKMNIPVIFPESYDIYLPQNKHFKIARNKIANLIKNKSINPGFYDFQEGIQKANIIRDTILSEINNVLANFNKKEIITFIISQIDALIFKDILYRNRIETSLTHEVDYEREEVLANQQTEFLKSYNIAKYLLEKTVSLNFNGNNNFDQETYQYLLALVDWLITIYHTSDSIKYKIFDNNKIEITHEFLLDIIYSDDNYAKKEKEFQKLISTRYLNDKSFNNFDAVKDKNDFYNKLDNVFLSDLNFSFIDMLTVMQGLQNWKNYKPNEKDFLYHKALQEEIIEILMKNIIIEKEKIPIILDFLELKQNEITKTLEKTNYKEHGNIPIWEHSKRFSRYTIKSLIKIDNYYYWGCCSIYKCRKIWEKFLLSFIFPYQCIYQNIKSFLEYWEENVQKYIVEKAKNIVTKHTPFILVEKKYSKIFFDLEKINPIEDLGDYDLLAYLKNNNIILNIECKYIRDSYCLKDAKRDIEKIFYGKDRNGKSYISKLIKRQEYLEKNYIQILKKNEWIKNDKEIKIIPIFLLKELTFFTMYPPEKTNIIFLDITNLEDYILQLS